ncbi:MAG: SPOR domain-containing protein, partial [Pseudomonadota bacterium]|nr:SPOR domain-containing protein [Pseudomonadota bacterium]
GYSNEGEAPDIAAEAQEPDADDFGATAIPAATAVPTVAPTAKPTTKPTAQPAAAVPTAKPTLAPTPVPTLKPTPLPTSLPATAAAVPTAKPAATAAAAVAPEGDRWWVQIGSYSDISNAREGETRLKALGIPVFIAPIDSPNGILYRVRGGPYSDKANSEKALAAVLKDGFTDARLVHP